MTGTPGFFKELVEINNPKAIAYDGYDDAIVGVAWVKRNGAVSCVLVYNYELIVKAVIDSSVYETGDDPWEEASEYVNFNIVEGYLGPHTPIVVNQDQLWECGS